MDPVLDVCVRQPIMDPVLDVCVRQPSHGPADGQELRVLNRAKHIWLAFLGGAVALLCLVCLLLRLRQYKRRLQLQRTSFSAVSLEDRVPLEDTALL